MEKHECEKKEVFAQIEETNKRFDKAIFGNGRPGLQQSVTELAIHVQTLNEAMPEFKKQIESFKTFKDKEEACRDNKWKNIQTVALYLGLFFTFSFSMLNYIQSRTVNAASTNTIVTDKATIEEAIREGKDFKLRGKDVTKEYEKGQQDEINNMNK